MINENDSSEFPGYPHYPAKDDIMNSDNSKKIDVDVENLSRSKASSSALPDKSVRPKQAENTDPLLGDVDDDIEQTKSAEDTNITADDLIALGEESVNFGTVEKLTDDDLDVPGSEDDDANEEIGEEDEENNYYSLGGDAHENLEEDKS